MVCPNWVVTVSVNVTATDVGLEEVVVVVPDVVVVTVTPPVGVWLAGQVAFEAEV